MSTESRDVTKLSAPDNGIHRPRKEGPANSLIIIPSAQMVETNKPIFWECRYQSEISGEIRSRTIIAIPG